MRSGSWLLICLWVLKWSLALGMGMTALSATSAHAAVDECHEHSTLQVEPSDSHSDSAHCTAHADCHHCCPLGWGHGLGMALHAAPNVHPSRHVDDWPSASWLPDLRPPIA